MNKLLTISQIKESPDKYLKWICHDIFISIDNQVLDLHFQVKKEHLHGGSYGYIVNGEFHSKKWIRGNCAIVLGLIYSD
jgi:hypothetical protein